MKDYSKFVMSNPDKYHCIVNLEDKLLVFKNIDTGFPSLHGMYTFLIWDEKGCGYVNCTMGVESFCEKYLIGVDISRKMSSKIIQMDSDGVKEINNGNNN